MSNTNGALRSTASLRKLQHWLQRAGKGGLRDQTASRALSLTIALTPTLSTELPPTQVQPALIYSHQEPTEGELAVLHPSHWICEQGLYHG